MRVGEIMIQKEIFEIMKYPIAGLFKCGSRVTCNPPILNTDEDWMIRVSLNDIEFIHLRLEKLGFTLGGSVCLNTKTLEHPQLFWSFTKDNINLLVTCSLGFYTKFFNATMVAKRLNLLNKNDRVMLFQAVLYNNYESNHGELDL